MIPYFQLTILLSLVRIIMSSFIHYFNNFIIEIAMQNLKSLPGVVFFSSWGVLILPSICMCSSEDHVGWWKLPGEFCKCADKYS